MGAAYPTRLSFSRALVRRMAREQWQFERVLFDLDTDGFGTAVLAVHLGRRTYSLVAFSHYLDPEKRTDRVIAEAWDATFNLFDGLPAEEDLTRLAANTPKQEAGRFTAKELVLARANKSVRLFEHVAASLAQGRQPSPDLLGRVGYLMRTTAVYGNGKFGCSDRARIGDREEFRSAFQVEMLCVYLIRWFTFELVEHIARCRGGEAACRLDGGVKRYLGIGNATGLGMAPFLVSHPALLHRWVEAKEQALVHVCARPSATPVEQSRWLALLQRANSHMHEWNVDDLQQQERIQCVREELASLALWTERHYPRPWQDHPWAALFRQAEAFSLEGQELITALLLEIDDGFADTLADQLFTDVEGEPLDVTMTVGELRALIDTHYHWLERIDFYTPRANKFFWYYSNEKFEPRLGQRAIEAGSELEMPVTVARDVHRLRTALQSAQVSTPLAHFLVSRPQHRHVAARVQQISQLDYGEIRDNLIGDGMRPIDLLRFKLAFFGASKFDPKSELWTRIALFQGAPSPQQLTEPDADDWAFPLQPR